jgi:hypothetical protein
MNPIVISEFYNKADVRNWQIVGDVVMGGRSSGSFTLNPDGYGEFAGNISLDNNGGFSSVHYQFNKLNVNKENKISILLKSDGKEYQLRIKDNIRRYYFYIHVFATSGEWQWIEIPLQEMYPSFRGNRLNLPDFSHNTIEEIVFLIGNKKAENFRLLVSKIELH